MGDACGGFGDDGVESEVRMKKKWGYTDGLPPISYVLHCEPWAEPFPYTFTPLPTKKRRRKHLISVKITDQEGNSMIARYTVSVLKPKASAKRKAK